MMADLENISQYNGKKILWDGIACTLSWSDGSSTSHLLNGGVWDDASSSWRAGRGENT